MTKTAEDQAYILCDLLNAADDQYVYMVTYDRSALTSSKMLVIISRRDINKYSLNWCFSVDADGTFKYV